MISGVTLGTWNKRRTFDCSTLAASRASPLTRQASVCRWWLFGPLAQTPFILWSPGISGVLSESRTWSCCRIRGTCRSSTQSLHALETRRYLWSWSSTDALFPKYPTIYHSHELTHLWLGYKVQCSVPLPLVLQTLQDDVWVRRLLDVE